MAYKSKKNADLISSNEDLEIEVKNLTEEKEKLQDQLDDMTKERDNYKGQADACDDLKICGNCLTYKYSELLQQYICGNNFKCRLFNEYCNSWEGGII